MCHFSWGGLPLHANVPIMHLHAVQPPPSCSQDPVQRCLLNDALINFSVTSVFWADAVIADKRDLVFDCEGRWKQPDEEFRVHHQSQGYFRGRSEKRRMRWRGRGRRWNGDSEDKQILMSNDPFCLLSCMRKRREHKADLGKQPFWRWLFMAKMKRRTKHWFTQHICMVSRKFSLGTAPRLQLKRCLLPLLQWMCLRLSEWSEGTVGREIKGSAYGDSWLLTISCCDNDFFCLAYPSFHWLTYPQSVWLESSVPSLRQSRNTLIKLQYIQIKNWKNTCSPVSYQILWSLWYSFFIFGSKLLQVWVKWSHGTARWMAAASVVVWLLLGVESSVLLLVHQIGMAPGSFPLEVFWASPLL